MAYLPIFRAILTTASNIPAIKIKSTTPVDENNEAKGSPDPLILVDASERLEAELPTSWNTTIMTTITPTTADAILETSILRKPPHIYPVLTHLKGF